MRPRRPRGRAVASPSSSVRARSFVFAGAGIWHVARNEPSAWIHAAATVLALGAAILLGISPRDWRWIAFAIVAVWSAEAFNTAIEKTCDLLSPGENERVRIAKDAAAGAVLLVSIGAAAIGFLTFWPYVAPPARRRRRIRHRGARLPRATVAAPSRRRPMDNAPPPHSKPSCRSSRRMFSGMSRAPGAARSRSRGASLGSR